MQAANELLLQLLQVPRPQPQPVITHLQPQQQQAARPVLSVHHANTSTAYASAQQHAPGLLSTSMHLQRQQQAQQTQARPASLTAPTSATLPSGASFVQFPAGTAAQAQVSAAASSNPLAVQITAANLPFASQPGTARPVARPEQATTSAAVSQQQQQKQPPPA